MIVRGEIGQIDPGYARAWALLAICQANRRMVNVGTGDAGWAAAARAQKQNLIWFRADNSLDPIRDDPRMQAMVARAEARLAAS